MASSKTEPHFHALYTASGYIICDVTNLLLYILSKIERFSSVSLETIESEFYILALDCFI